MAPLAQLVPLQLRTPAETVGPVHKACQGKQMEDTARDTQFTFSLSIYSQKSSPEPNLRRTCTQAVSSYHRRGFHICPLLISAKLNVNKERDLFIWITKTTDAPPPLQMEHLMTVLLGMLGLGGLRTYEKIKDKVK